MTFIEQKRQQVPDIPFQFFLGAQRELLIGQSKQDPDRRKDESEYGQWRPD